MMDEHLQIQHRNEVAFLGSLIIDNDLIDDCYISPKELIADERHPFILEAILYAYERRGQVDPVILLETAREVGEDLSGMGGASYLVELSGAVPSTNHFENYQRSIREAYVAREARSRMSSLSVSMQYQGNVQEGLSRMQAEIDELQEMVPKKRSNDMVKASQALKEHVEAVKERSESDGKPEILTISEYMDALTGGQHLEDFEVTAARPSVGKTAYAINLSNRTLKPGDAAVAFFSCEMPNNQLVDRFICTIGNIDLQSLKRGNLDMDEWDRYHTTASYINRQHLYFDDTPGLTVEDVRRKVKRLKKNLSKVGITKIVVIIDYLQLLETEKRFPNAQERVAYISKMCKRIARELKVKVNALSQLSRDVEKRQDKRPMMSDLRDSGSIEQDADNIVFLHRDDYYNKDTEKKNIVEIIIAKQRNGPLGSVEMVFLKQFGKYSDLDRDHHGGAKK